MSVKVVAVCIAALVVPIAGCGDGDGGDDEPAARAVRAAYATMAADFARGDLAALCRRMSASAKRHVGVIGHGRPTRCERDVRMVVRAVRAGERRAVAPPPRLVRVEVDGDRAYATASFAGRSPTTFPFVREAGRWRIDNLFGIAKFPPREG